ncbi:Tail completion protein R (GpR) [Shigella sonnei]|nr:Tail completion protein R (GpR) [Shigella sonnei]
MLKPDSLRRALTDAVTVLKTSPEMLRIFVDNGSIASTLATSLSFEKRYTLNVIVTDFTGDFDLLIVPVRIPLYSITDWHRSSISDSHPFDQPGT